MISMNIMLNVILRVIAAVLEFPMLFIYAHILFLHFAFYSNNRNEINAPQNIFQYIYISIFPRLLRQFHYNCMYTYCNVTILQCII